MLGLPKRPPRDPTNNASPCTIFFKSKAIHKPHGKTTNTNSYNNGDVIHIDFFFMNKPSIRCFTSVLLIIDAESRKLWIFCTAAKTPPLTTLRYFLSTITTQDITIKNIIMDEGGELARSEEFFTLLHD